MRAKTNDKADCDAAPVHVDMAKAPWQQPGPDSKAKMKKKENRHASQLHGSTNSVLYVVFGSDNQVSDRDVHQLHGVANNAHHDKADTYCSDDLEVFWS